MGKVLAVGDIHTKIWIIEKVAKVINDYDKVFSVVITQTTLTQAPRIL